MKKFISLLLALAMVMSLAACGGGTAEPEDDGSSAVVASETAAAETDAAETGDAAAASDGSYTVYERTGDHDTDSEVLYYAALGDFYDAYQTAMECEENDQRYALMAIAEAKLLEAGTFVPQTSQGGYYGLRRVAPYTATTVNWGSDMDRFHNVVVTNEPITAADYNEMKAMWAELRGTGTYEQSVKDYLTEKGYTMKDTYTFAYSSDPTTWDMFTTFLAANNEAIVNTFDGLMEYDCENELQPALAESYEVSDDGLTYTFHLREGLKWVDAQGREIADLTADDFVAGMQHFLDGGSGAEYLAGLEGACILNADEYYAGDITDFSEVGVKAVDDLTVEYTLSQPCSYFMTLLTYTTFAPLCRSYFLSQGGGFGADYDSSACQYGIDSDHLAYCGAYTVTSATAQNSIVFQANPLYWNADGINIKTITWLYNDGSDPTKSFNDFENGVTDSCSLDASTIEIAQEEGVFDDYAIVSGTDATAFVTYNNMNRTAFANYNDETKVVSEKTEEQKEVTYAAMNDQHFRLALCYALDRTAYNAQIKGDELADVNLINSYVLGTFVSLENDTTVDINGTETTYPAGTWYGQILQDQITADGYPIKVWDPDADNGIGSSAGFDGWYNPEEAVNELNQAIEDLAANGIEVTTDNPIVLDYPVWAASETYSNKANAYKQSIESTLGGLVQVNLVTCNDTDEWYYTEYYCYDGTEMNYDIGDQSGWSADFGDPSTYLTTMMPDYSGYCTASLGLY